MPKQDKIPSEDWRKLNPTDMPETLQKLYANKQAADATSRAARETFESAYSEALVTAGVLPAGHVARFGYNFGQLSMADPAKHRFTKNGKAKSEVFNPFQLLGPDKKPRK